jgi:hypothetical protein
MARGPGDATADGDVDGNDLAVWRARYGAVSGQRSAVSQKGKAEESGVAWLAVSRDAESAERSAERGRHRVLERLGDVGKFLRNSPSDFHHGGSAVGGPALGGGMSTRMRTWHTTGASPVDWQDGTAADSAVWDAAFEAWGAAIADRARN